MRTQAILFDLDGTLLDSLADIGNSMNTVLTRTNLPCHPLDSYRYFVGDGIEQLAIRCLPPDSPVEMIRKIVDGMRKEYATRWAESTKPYDGILPLLECLSEKSIRLNILSNKPHALTTAMVGHFFPGYILNHVWGAQAEYPKKPDPKAALSIAFNEKIRPEGFIYAGDTSTDMQTARAAGMYAVGVSWGFRNRQELLEYGADRIVDHPMELLDIIEGMK